ncbi:DNA repair protein RadA [Feifania hominis]|uniref:DNA repair protein RadA n=1 Tax=Feifania hominis TaxID=2763660 RepID=UPI003211AF82
MKQVTGKNKTVFVCGSCGFESLKWYGKCPGCNEWNTMEEQLAPAGGTAVAPKAVKRASAREASADPVSIRDLTEAVELRCSSGLSELDRVLGGGMVKGSVILYGGEPGIGKSTMMLQVCEELGRSMRILYISGEESLSQIKLRARRLGVNSDNLYLLAETEIDHITEVIEKQQPGLVIIDSVQTLYSRAISSIPGSISQIKECTLRLVDLAKAHNISMFLVGHINKEGAIAGPKVLEHMVDAVVYFEGDKNLSFRIIRSSKNRYGSTNEIGVFEMGDKGLIEVQNPSKMLLSGRPLDVPGTCPVCVMEGTRAILAEVQALVSQTSFGNPRRTSNGIDYNRFCMLLAVLEKRAGLSLATCDAYINVIGGLKLDEPSSDLAVVLACASAFKERSVEENLIAFGEVGLVGEVRSVRNVEQRILESRRLGFDKFVIPYHNKPEKPIEGVEVYPVRSISEAIAVALK